MSVCIERGCGRVVVARGMCRYHYLREYRAGRISEHPLKSREPKVCPPDHPHDVEECWSGHGCRCPRCAHLRRMDRQRRRARLNAYGRADQIRSPRVPARDVREHVATLHKYAGLERIADAAQVSRSVVLDVWFGRRGKNRQAYAGRPLTVDASAAARLLALTAEDLNLAAYPAVGTVRRLRALVALGHTQSDLARRLGMHVGNFNHLILGSRHRVLAGTYRDVCALFAELWAKPQAGARAEQARGVAKRRGWYGPLAWDDIDDPDAVPSRDAPVQVLIDETAVELAIAGEGVRLRPAERREAVRRLHAVKLSDGQIAERLRVDSRTVLRVRQELDLPAAVGADGQVVA